VVMKKIPVFCHVTLRGMVNVIFGRNVLPASGRSKSRRNGRFMKEDFDSSLQKFINLLAPELYFFNFSTPCI